MTSNRDFSWVSTLSRWSMILLFVSLLCMCTLNLSLFLLVIWKVKNGYYSSYANINDIDNFRTLHNSFNTKLIDLEFADSPDVGKISKACDALAEIDDRIVQFSALQDVGQSQTRQGFQETSLPNSRVRCQVGGRHFHWWVLDSLRHTRLRLGQSRVVRVHT